MERHADVSYLLLGPVQVLVDGAVVPISSARQRRLLVALLLHRGSAVPAASLCDAIWGADVPEHPGAALRSQISRLRRSLHGRIRPSGGDQGYRLDVRGDELDVFRFEELLARAARAAEDELGLLDDALALWRGPAISEFADHEWVRPTVVRLDELRVSARERRAELLLGMDRSSEAVVALREMLSEYPERERTRALLMRALYRTGRHTDSLAEYHTWERYLADQKGLEPSPELRRLESEILRHRVPDGDAPRRAEPRGAASPLPRPLTSFIGRARDATSIESRLGATRVLTLTGPGGVGKTRLALETAARLASWYPDGVVFCDLAPTARRPDVTRTIARAFRVREAAGSTLESHLIECLSTRRALIVLDNCEHVVEHAAATITPILRSTQHAVVLATSRERLGVDGEVVWPVDPLPFDTDDAAAVELFLDRARQVAPRFAATPADLTLIRQICRRVDGLPLAIEMAAAASAALRLEDVLDVLGDRLELLHARSRPEQRHRSLRRVIDWSYARLPWSEQQVFNALCVFAGSFDLEGACAIVPRSLDRTSVAQHVARLVERSMLTCDDPRDAAPYRMLQTLRTYGLDRSRERNELAGTQRRHADWMIEIASAAADGIASPDERGWIERLDRHVDDLRAAHRWLVSNDPEGALRLSDALHPYAFWHGRGEVFRWAEVAAAVNSSSPQIADLLASVCAGAWMRGDIPAAETAARAAVAAAADLQSPRSRRVNQQLGELALLRGDTSGATTYHLQAHRQSLLVGDLFQACWNIGSASLALTYAGRTDEARVLAQDTLALARRCGSPSARAFAHFTQGELSAALGSDDAIAELQAAIVVAQTVGNALIEGLAGLTLATVASRTADRDRALDQFQCVIGMWDRLGAWTSQCVTLRNLTHFLTRIAAYEDAAVLYGAITSDAIAAPAFGSDETHLREIYTELVQRMDADDLATRIQHGRCLERRLITDAALTAIRHARAHT